MLQVNFAAFNKLYIVVGNKALLLLLSNYSFQKLHCSLAHCTIYYHLSLCNARSFGYTYLSVLPEHENVLQVLRSMLKVGHELSLSCVEERRHRRLLSCMPLSQDFEHEPHSLQGFQPETREKDFYIEIYTYVHGPRS